MNKAKYLVLWLSILIFPNWGNTSTKHFERNTFFYQKIKTLKEDLYLQLNLNGEAMPTASFEMATEEVMPVGSYIINMGVQPQTEENGLKPYGLIWELLNTHRIPIKWIIRTGKGKDEADFTYNSIDFKGGPFIISADYRTAAVNNTINFWEGEGVEGVTTNMPITVPVERTLTHSLQWTLDDKNGKIGEKYLEMGGIPSTAYDFVEPANLDCCSDIFVIPHADPDWDSHQSLLSWNDRLENGGCQGNIWMGCQAVSNVENLVNPSNNAERLNFLMNNPLTSNGDPAVDHGDHKNGEAPYQYDYHDHPIMQFIGLTDGAQEGGSEQIYLPTNGWRPTTLIGVWDNDHEDVPSLSSGPAAKIAFGPAFGDANRGKVLYEGGHTLDGNDPENIAAIRAFFNFSFMAANDRAIKVAGNVPLVMDSQADYALNGTATGGNGTYNYQWTTSCGGTFTNALAANTNFTPPTVTTTTDCILQLTVTDGCGNRFGYYVTKVELNPASNPTTSCPYLSTVSNAVPTHTTIADGNWNNAATWQGGNIPNGNLSGSIVNIQHNISRANNVAIGSGMLNILGTLMITNDNFIIDNTGANLNVDHGAILISNGNFELRRGTLTLNYAGIQICNGNYSDESAGGTNGNGYIYTANGNVEDVSSGNFSTAIAWCAAGNGVGLPTSEDCSIANPSGGCLDQNYYKTLCTGGSGQKIISGKVFQDINEDGSDNGGTETGISGVTVYIYEDRNQDGLVDNNDVLIHTTSTDINGDYSYVLNETTTIAADDFTDATWDGTTWGGGTGWAGGWNDDYGESGGNLGPNLGTNGGGGWNVGIINCNQTNNHNNCEPFGTSKLSLENNDYISRPIDLSGQLSVDFSFDLETVGNNDDGDILTIKICTDNTESNCYTLYTNGPTNGNFAETPITVNATLNDPTYLTANAQLFFHIDGFSGSAEYVYISKISVNSTNALRHLVITTDSSSINSNYYYTTDNIETATFSTGIPTDTQNNFGIGEQVQIVNEVWLDLNANSLRDPLEIGIDNLPVCIANKAPFLLNGILQPINAYQDTVLTNAAGIYTFDNLPDCDNWEIVAHNAPSLYTPTYDADGGILGTINFNLHNGVVSAIDNAWCEIADCIDDLDFGFSLAGEFDLSGTICLDDGSKDGTCGTGGEEKIAMLEVLLFDDKGTFFGGVTNNSEGTYLFPFLPEDNYIVSLDIQQRALDTFLFTTKVAMTPAEEILITTDAIFQKVAVLANVTGVDYAFIPHAANKSTVIANDDVFSFCPGLSFDNWVIANDTVNEDAYFFSTVTLPQKGTLTLNNNGAFQYLPTIFECGMDEFSYQLCDLTSGDCDTAKVTLIFEDTSIPSLSNIPDDLTLSCDETLPDPALVSAFDNCPRITIDIQEKSTQGEDGCSQYDYALQRTWMATDICGNLNSAIQSIKVQDVAAPNIFRIYTLPNGKKLVAGVTEFVGERWKTVPLPIDFDEKPLVFTQIMTQTDAAPAITQIRQVSKAQFELRLKQEEAATQVHAREKVAWIAIEQGAQVTDYPLIANTLGVGSQPETIDFENDFSAIPTFFTAQQTTDEPDPTIVQYQNLTTAAVTLNLKEELSKDGELHHNKEEIAYLGVENIGNLTNVEGIIIGESGTSTTDNEWRTIPLMHTYYNPVILVDQANASADFPILIQVSNVTTTSFDVRVATWDYLNTTLTNTPINYLVIEGSIPLYIPTFCDTGNDHLMIGKDMIAIDNCDNSVELGYSEMKRFNNGEQVIDRRWQSVDECGNEVIYKQQLICEGIAVKIKTYLQGALVGSNETGLMRDDLRKKRLIPPKEPYSFLTGFQHFGNGGGEELLPELLEVQGANAIVDWVLIEIRSGTDRNEIIATSTGLVQRDGDIISATGDSLVVFENIPYGDYFVGVRHRNHIGVITKDRYSFDLNNIPEIDFRNVFTPTEGKRPGIQIDGQNALWSGDLNGDGKTIYQGPKNDPFEMFLSVILDTENEHFLVNYINRGYTHRDFNLDGQVIFQGPNNDRSNLLFNTILAHPDNKKFLANFIVIVAPE